ncbi:MAG: NAD regulator [Rhizobiales bacterium]|nr:NAD regulator [Hyphomicrobiales bacterium]
MADTHLTPIEVGLTAAIVAVEAEEPRILVAADPNSEIHAGLPFGPFDPLAHRTFEIGLRSWVAAQTAINVGYVEQLYTFGDRGRHAHPGDVGPHMISVGYLALTRMSDNAAALRTADADFEPWYRFFPWEDWRGGKPDIVDRIIVPLLEQWAKSGKGETPHPLGRRERLRHCFGVEGSPWDEEKVLDRYELLYEAGLVEEARRDGREAAVPRTKIPRLGEPMRFDHRRILATAIARLRAKLKYRPVVFELMPGEFTLTELQRTVEAISGRHLHKQNFRRLVESAALVEPTGETSTTTGGRPAALFRFRRDVVQERPAPGLRLGGRG